MKKIYSISILMLSVILTFSCTNVSESDLVNSQPPPTIVTYQDIKTTIDNNCIGCHKTPPVNGANTSLTTYNDVKNGVINNNLIGRISAQAGANGAMPLGGPRLPQNLIDQIIQWEDDGLLEN